MEKTMKIQKVLPIQDRQYNDQQGQPRVFTRVHTGTDPLCTSPLVSGE